MCEGPTNGSVGGTNEATCALCLRISLRRSVPRRPSRRPLHLAALPHVDKRLPSVIVDADPLKIGRVVRSTRTQRPNVIHLETGARPAVLRGRRAGVNGTEGADLAAVAGIGVSAWNTDKHDAAKLAQDCQELGLESQVENP